MEETIKGYLEQAKIGRGQSCKNLTVFPLLSDYSVELDFLLLDEALGCGALHPRHESRPSAVFAEGCERIPLRPGRDLG